MIKAVTQADQTPTSLKPELEWSPWVSFDGGDFCLIPRGAGLYRVRVAGQAVLAYVGQTGRDLRQRLIDLRRNTLAAVMPFNDPHTAAPSLWAWRDAEGYKFECSAAAFAGDTRIRLALECSLLWQHRLEHGVSTLCNYGRFHGGYAKSGNRGSGRRGGRVPTGKVNPAGGPCTVVLRPHGSAQDTDWMGLSWSPWADLRAWRDVDGTGLYRIAERGRGLLYIGESAALAARLRSHARSDWRAGVPMVSVASVAGVPAKYRLHELECDLIAGHFDELGTVPAMQFLDGRVRDGT